MNKLFYPIIIVLLMATTKGNAQFAITGYSVSYDTTDCSRTYLHIYTSSTTLNVRSYFNGTVDSTLSYFSFVSFTGVANFAYDIPIPGNYTFKIVMDDSLGFRCDSIIINLTKLHCGFSTSGLYVDANSNCVYDAADYELYSPALIEVSTGGTPVDTLSCYNSINFMNTGTAGTVYQYRLLQAPTGYTLDCPSSGIILDTVGVFTIPKRFGFHCGSSSDFDLQGFVRLSCGTHQIRCETILKNNHCNPVTATHKISISPKYSFLISSPAPSAITDGNPSWLLYSMTVNSSAYIRSIFETPGSIGLPYGDTVNSRHELTPLTGDINPSNNIIVRVDTVKAGYDPNDIAVYPPGEFSSGDELEYTVRFENTGNDTAFNIYVLDTLPDNVAFNSLNILASSHHPINTIMYSSGGHNIVKFDFPNINLLDSSHHDECNGMFVFKVKSNSGLPYGTEIKNRAGIYFDYNPVVLTNTVTNYIPFPTAIEAVEDRDDFAIYPNPVDDKLYINATNTQINTVTITNVVGQVIKTVQQVPSGTTVDVQSLAPGIYFLYIAGEGRSSVKRFEKL